MSLISITKEARRVKQQHGISLWCQLGEALRLRIGPSKLDPWEYYFFQVYRSDYSQEEKRAFAGWQRELIIDRQANQGSRDIANDKLLFHNLMAAHALPVVPLQAVFGTHHAPENVTHLADRASLESWLQNATQTFIKPARGARGKNLYQFTRTSNDEPCVIDEHGRALDTLTLIDQLTTSRNSGYLFQEILHSHATLRATCGNRITTARLIIIVTDDGPEIHSAVWRCPTGDNIADNFDAGRRGNLIANIDLATGDVGTPIQGIGWRNQLASRHPDTNCSLTDLTIPDWLQLKTASLRAAELLPQLRLQHWDIAIGEDGPVLLEVNVEGGMRTHQIVQQRGIIRGQLARLLSDLR